MTRPAETAGAAGAIGVLVGRIAGVNDPTVLAYIGAAVGLIPGVVTFVVSNGGVRGLLGKVWRGKPAQPS